MLTTATLLLLAAAAAPAQTLDGMLAKGQVTLVETGTDGRLTQVTTLTRIQAPIDAVWARLIDFDDYENWMPQVSKSNVTERNDNELTVAWGIKVPGPNVQFTAEYVLEPSKHTVTATGVKGAVSGGKWTWELVDEGAVTLVKRKTFSSAVVDNWLVRQFDDDAHTLELGLNTASPLVEVRGLKAACER